MDYLNINNTRANTDNTGDSTNTTNILLVCLIVCIGPICGGILLRIKCLVEKICSNKTSSNINSEKLSPNVNTPQENIVNLVNEEIKYPSSLKEELPRSNYEELTYYMNDNMNENKIPQPMQNLFDNNYENLNINYEQDNTSINNSHLEIYKIWKIRQKINRFKNFLILYRIL